MTDDRAALGRAQRGERSAFDLLYEEHAPVCWRLALVVSRDSSVAARPW